jgi:hypothetical protein
VKPQARFGESDARRCGRERIDQTDRDAAPDLSQIAIEDETAVFVLASGGL